MATEANHPTAGKMREQYYSRFCVHLCKHFTELYFARNLSRKFWVVKAGEKAPPDFHIGEAPSVTMARKSSRNKGKWNPVHRTLRYKINANDVEQSRFIDIAKDLSELNRRLYRQGRAYTVKNWSIEGANKIWTVGSSLRVALCTAPNNWVTKGAWNAGYKAWRHQVKQVMDAAGEVSNAAEGSYADYKIYLTEEMRQSVGTAGLLRISDSGGNASMAGEWQHVEYHAPDGTGGTTTDTFTAHLMGDDTMTGSNVESMGLIANYAKARATVSANTPNLVASFPDNLFFKLLDDGQVIEDIATSVQTNNDDPPYPIASYIGGAANMNRPQMIQRLQVAPPSTATSSDAGVGVGVLTAVSTRPFEVPFGMLEVEFQGADTDQNFDLIIEVAAGDYHGVKAPSCIY